MLNHNARNESGRILRLTWAVTGNKFTPLRSSWSVYIPDETPLVTAPGVSEACNTTVIETCDTSLTRPCVGVHAVSLAMCGK